MKNNNVVNVLILSLTLNNLASSKVTNYESGYKVRCDDKNLSAKARRHFCSDFSTSEDMTNVDENALEEIETNTEVSVDDYDFDDFRRNRDSLFRPENPITYQVPVTTTQSNFMDDDGEVLCSDLMEGFDDMSNCKNETEPELEVRWRDVVFEKLIRQSWRDTQNQINQNKTYAGVTLEPLILDKIVPTQPPVDISESSFAYSADLKMWDIEVQGLSKIYMSQALVTRSKNLFDFDVNVQLKFDKLKLKGISIATNMFRFTVFK